MRILDILVPALFFTLIASIVFWKRSGGEWATLREKIGKIRKSKTDLAKEGTEKNKKKDTPKPATTPGQKAKNILGWAGVALASSVTLAFAFPFIILAVFLVSLAIGIVKQAFTPVRPIVSTQVAQTGFRTINATSVSYANANDDAFKEFSGNPRDQFASSNSDKDSIIALLPDPKDSMLIEFSAAESSLRQYKAGAPRNCENVVVNQNKNGTEDIGALQINSSHEEEAKSLDFDICTLKGNLGYGQVLFHREGSNPWNSSSCFWREHYTKCQRGTTFDRTRTQMVDGTTQNALEVIIADAPSDTTWSTMVYTYGRPMQVEASNKTATIDILIHGKGDKLDTVEIGPGIHDTLKFTPVAYQVRRIRSDSLAGYLPVLFTRGK